MTHTHTQTHTHTLTADGARGSGNGGACICPNTLSAARGVSTLGLPDSLIQARPVALTLSKRGPLTAPISETNSLSKRGP